MRLSTPTTLRGIPNGTPASGFNQTFTVTIDDNGAAVGGNVVNGSITYDGSSQTTDNAANTVNLVGWNLSTDVNTANNNDTVTTTWNNGPTASGQDIDYVGGNGTDSITMVFTAFQLEEVLSNSTSQAALQGYLDGSPTGASLNLGATSWNAMVDNFETAQLAISAGSNSIVTYTAIGSDLPDLLAGSIGDASNNTLVGTSGIDSLDGAGGNDILVGLGSNDSLLGSGGADMLLCGSGNDTLNGGTESDVLSGGRGADTFVFSATGASNVDLVVDYSYVEGDKIDLSALLDANFGLAARCPISCRSRRPGRTSRCRSMPTVRSAGRTSSTLPSWRTMGRRRCRISCESSSKVRTRASESDRTAGAVLGSLSRARAGSIVGFRWRDECNVSEYPFRQYVTSLPASNA